MMSSDRPFVIDETAPDESVLVGTRAQLEAFARSILRTLDTPALTDEWHGVRVSQPRQDVALMDPLADVVLSGVVVVESEADRRALVNAIRANGGDPAIDWEGHDALRARPT